MVLLCIATHQAHAQVPAINDTVQVAGGAVISGAQWRYGTWSFGGVNYRLPYLGNTGINKIDFVPTSKYLRAFYSQLSGGNTFNGTQLLNSGAFVTKYGVPFAFSNPANTAALSLLVTGVSAGNHQNYFRGDKTGVVALLPDIDSAIATLPNMFIQNSLSVQSGSNLSIDGIGQTQTAFVAGNYLTSGAPFASHSAQGYSVVNSSGIVGYLKAGEIALLNSITDLHPWKVLKNNSNTSVTLN